MGKLDVVYWASPELPRVSEPLKARATVKELHCAPARKRIDGSAKYNRLAENRGTTGFNGGNRATNRARNYYGRRNVRYEGATRRGGTLGWI